MADLREPEREVEEAVKIKRLVLKLLHLEGIMAFDASTATLDPEWEVKIQGKG